MTITLSSIGTASLSEEVPASNRQRVPFGTSDGHTAARVITNDDVGGHKNSDNSALVISSTPVGSGVNGPGQADYGLQVSVVKNHLSSSVSHGEVDGVNSLVRNKNDDSASYLANAGTVNGASYILEGVSSQFSQDYRRVLKQWDVQLGAVETGATASNAYDYGEVLTAQLGDLGGGLLIQSAKGAAMREAIVVKDVSAGQRTFSVLPDGALTATRLGVVEGDPVIMSQSPVIASGLAEKARIVTSNGTAAFEIALGISGVLSTGKIALPHAVHRWACGVNDLTTTTSTVFLTKVTAATADSITLTNFNTSGAAVPWAKGDVLQVQCTAY